MIVPFEEFVRNVRLAELKGEMKVSVPLTDYDLAVQWAVCKLYDKGKKEMTITEIWHELPEEYKDVVLEDSL